MNLPTASLAAALALALALTVASPRVSEAQAAAGPPPASYTTAQADNGQLIYQNTCAGCHGEDLSGGEGPPLVGQPLVYTWGGRPITGLLRFVQNSMPMNAPGTLDAESAANVLAYVLSRNGVAAGSTPLAAGSNAVLLVPPPDGDR